MGATVANLALPAASPWGGEIKEIEKLESGYKL